VAQQLTTATPFRFLTSRAFCRFAFCQLFFLLRAGAAANKGPPEVRARGTVHSCTACSAGRRTIAQAQNDGPVNCCPWITPVESAVHAACSRAEGRWRRAAAVSGGGGGGWQARGAFCRMHASCIPLQQLWKRRRRLQGPQQTMHPAAGQRRTWHGAVWCSRNSLTLLGRFATVQGFLTSLPRPAWATLLARAALTGCHAASRIVYSCRISARPQTPDTVPQKLSRQARSPHSPPRHPAALPSCCNRDQRSSQPLSIPFRLVGSPARASRVCPHARAANWAGFQFRTTAAGKYKDHGICGRLAPPLRPRLPPPAPAKYLDRRPAAGSRQPWLPRQRSCGSWQTLRQSRHVRQGWAAPVKATARLPCAVGDVPAWCTRSLAAMACVPCLLHLIICIKSSCASACHLTQVEPPEGCSASPLSDDNLFVWVSWELPIGGLDCWLGCTALACRWKQCKPRLQTNGLACCSPRVNAQLLMAPAWLLWSTLPLQGASILGPTETPWEVRSAAACP